MTPLGTPKTFKNAEKHGKMMFEFGGRFLMPKSDDLEQSGGVEAKGWRQGWGPSEGGEASPRSYAEDSVFMSSTPCYL